MTTNLKKVSWKFSFASPQFRDLFVKIYKGINLNLISISMEQMKAMKLIN